ncbi:MAG: hypothetical protein WCF85_12350 [Rhodospirillaceae bacterium]
MRRESALVLFVCLLLAVPAIVSSVPSPVGWDDAYYLHRAACITKAMFEPMQVSYRECLTEIVKAPLMAWLSWPWGPKAATVSGIGLPFVSMAVVTFGIVLALGDLMLRLAIPRLLILLAFACLALNPILLDIAGNYEGDTIMALLVALLIMLVPQEALRPNPGAWKSVGRGLAWGAVIATGVMAKTSFGFFAVLITPVLFYLRTIRSGAGAATLALLVCVAVCAPVIAYHLIYWNEIVGHVLVSTVGPLAKYTSYNLDSFAYLKALFARYGSVPMILAGITAIVGWRLGSQRPAGLWAPLWPLLVLVGYLGLTAACENHDMRYGLPFLVGLPFALVALTASTTPARGVGPRGLPILGMIAILLAVPITARPNLHYVREAEAVLATLPTDRPFKLLVASDDSAINVDTFQLARMLNLPRFRNLYIDTVVYDEAHGQSLEAILARLEQADGVVLLKAPIRKSPDWTNVHAPRFRDHLQAVGATRPDNTGSALIELYLLNHAEKKG